MRIKNKVKGKESGMNEGSVRETCKKIGKGEMQEG